ncbi:MAG TPA: hypothetical protein DCY74_08620 [Clostridiales bacterium]|nr:hypothetical protein [Clostridiales bacterium]
MNIHELAYIAPDKLQIHLVQLSVFSVKPHHRYVYALGKYIRIVYIEAGGADFTLGKQILSAKSRNMVYLPPDSVYTSHWRGDAPSRFFVLDINITDRQNCMLGFGQDVCILFTDTTHMYQGYLKDIESLPDNTPLAWLDRTALALNLYREIAREVTMAKLGQQYRQIYKGILFIEKNYTQKFTIQEVAAMCFISEGHFRKLFYACKHTSPLDYRNSLRIRRATELLKSNLYSVTQAGEAVGFDDVKYFSKLFKRYTGVSPGTLI